MARPPSQREGCLRLLTTITRRRTPAIIRQARTAYGTSCRIIVAGRCFIPVSAGVAPYGWSEIMGNPRQSPSGCLTTPRRVRRPRYERDRCRRPTSLAGIPPAQSGRQGGGESSFRYSRKRCNPSTAHCDSAGSVTSSHPFSIIAWPCRALQDLEGERGLDGSTRPLTRSGKNRFTASILLSSRTA